MSDQSSTIISKVWGMRGPLRDDGVSYGNPPSPDVLADEIIENLQGALESFNELRATLGGGTNKV